MIYAEWVLYNEFYCAFFNTHSEYHEAMFNPEIELLLVKEVFNSKKKRRKK